MGGIAKSFNVNEIHQGPGELWVIDPAPTDAAKIVSLHTDGTPAAATHATSKHLGAIASAITFDVKPKIESIMLDQYDAPVDVFVSQLETKMSAEMAQSDVEKLQRALGVATYAAGPPKQLTFGGTTLVPTFCIAAISPHRVTASKWIVACLYRVAATGGIQITISRTKTSFYKVEFTGLCDLNRTAGRQIGIVHEAPAA